MCGRICSSITTRLLSVAKAPATVSLSGLQKPPLLPALQLRAFQDLGAVPTSQWCSGPQGLSTCHL